MAYVTNAGYNPWAEANNLVILYPQVQVSKTKPSNPSACWNWWGYNNNPDSYDTKEGFQMKMVRQMIDHLASGPNGSV